MNVEAFKREYGLSNNKIIDVMSDGFPQYDKRLHSKACNPEKSGVTICPKGVKLLRSKFAVGKRHKADLPTVKCRLPAAVRDTLMAELSKEGHHTQQAGLGHLINKYLEGKGIRF